jgi:prepilin-type processing-associated H-X9-DG protein
VPGGAGNANYADGSVASIAQRAPVLSVDRINATPSDYRVAQFASERSNVGRTSGGRTTSQPDASLRPEMRRALQRLRELPPFAREREIETGRYSQFSPEDKQLLRNGA